MRRATFPPSREIDISQQFVHSMMVDETYSLVTMHIDDATYKKIINHEYVDFAKLIAKDRVMDEDRGVELVPMLKGGKTVFAPTHDRDSTAITNYARWEQAFRVYSAIFSREFPTRAHELIQYNHIIHTAALTYVWSNVYAYDRDFRIHLSIYPDRTWGIIMQQMWTYRLRTKLSETGGGNSGNFSGGGNRYNGNNGNGYSRKEHCYRFNRGK